MLFVVKIDERLRSALRRRVIRSMMTSLNEIREMGFRAFHGFSKTRAPPPVCAPVSFRTPTTAFFPQSTGIPGHRARCDSYDPNRPCRKQRPAEPQERRFPSSGRRWLRQIQRIWNAWLPRPTPGAGATECSHRMTHFGNCRTIGRPGAVGRRVTHGSLLHSMC